MKSDSETRGWKRDKYGGYQKTIDGHEYTVAKYTDDWDNTVWCAWPYFDGNFYWEEAVCLNWLRCADAKRAAHAHARETK